MRTMLIAVLLLVMLGSAIRAAVAQDSCRTKAIGRMASRLPVLRWVASWQNVLGTLVSRRRSIKMARRFPERRKTLH